MSQIDPETILDNRLRNRLVTIPGRVAVERLLWGPKLAPPSTPRKKCMTGGVPRNVSRRHKRKTPLMSSLKMSAKPIALEMHLVKSERDPWSVLNPSGRIKRSPSLTLQRYWKHMEPITMEVDFGELIKINCSSAQCQMLPPSPNYREAVIAQRFRM